MTSTPSLPFGNIIRNNLMIKSYTEEGISQCRLDDKTPMNEEKITNLSTQSDKILKVMMTIDKSMPNSQTSTELNSTPVKAHSLFSIEHIIKKE